MSETEPSPEVLRLARDLVARTGSSDVAFLQDTSRVLYAAGAEPGSPFSATTNLIQGIHERHPEQARKLLRARIFSTREPGPFAHGMVKVAARRLTVLTARETSEPLVGPLGEEISYELTARPGDGETGREEGPRLKKSHDDWLEHAASLVGERRDDRPRHELDRAVGAVLVSSAGELIAASANTNATNRTRHAELNVLVRAWRVRKSKLPPGTRLYATLEPCKMCAGLAWELSAEPGTLEVYFRERELGPAARDSILEPGSNARRRFAKTAAERAAVCLFRVERP